MVIDSTFAYDFVDLDLRVEIFFDKERLTENGGVDFEIGDVSTSAHLYWWLKKISCRVCLFFLLFFGDKKTAFKSSFDLCFHSFIIEFF